MTTVLSLSYGKDSLACLGAIEQLGWPLDRIVHAEVWATDTIPADPPTMVEFKAHADAIIKKRWGLDVEHICARGKNGEKVTYEKLFYHIPERREREYNGLPKGWPMQRGSWCKKLKTELVGVAYPDQKRRWVVPQPQAGAGAGPVSKEPCGAANSKQRTPVFSNGPLAQGARKNIVQYLGIAADEPVRIERHTKPGVLLPLVTVGWTEAMCRDWCEANDLLSPIYTTATRGGCWFCHNQGVDQLRRLRHDYPEYWTLMLKWDADSPVSFHPDGHTVHDFERRFQLEDDGFLSPYDKVFRWAMLDQELNYRWF